MIERIWSRDATLWKGNDPVHAHVIANRLGWLDVPNTMRTELPRFRALQEQIQQRKIRDCVVLGMGGSSLCAEVFRTTFESSPGFPVLHVLDTTDPGAIRTLTDSLDLRASLFIVASKSGTTLETLSHFAHFWDAVTTAGVDSPGQAFVAITDPGTPLAALAHDKQFMDLFENPADIGGRYSALSFFGLVPAAIMGIDIAILLDRAGMMMAQCTENSTTTNGGARLGRFLFDAYRAGRDKVTLVTPPQFASFPLWAEQLFAESTGKDSVGLIPVGTEPLGVPDVYGPDRAFVALHGDDDVSVDKQMVDIEKAGHAVNHCTLTDRYDIAAEFFRFEFATAFIGAELQVDPFDEPNVQESKDNTRRLLAGYETDGAFPSLGSPTVASPTIALYGDVHGSTPHEALAAFLNTAHPADYVALLAYVTPDAAHHDALTELQVAIRDRYHAATTVGFGPRYLHSTGQLHKGGPNSGVFVLVTTDDAVDVPIPGQPFTFSTLKEAQGRGDIESLRRHGRRLLHVHIPHNVPIHVSNLAHTLSHSAGVSR